MARVTGSVDAARGAVEAFFADANDDSRDRRVMARAGGALFVAGGLLGLVSLLLPRTAELRPAGIAAVCGVSIVLGTLLLFERGRLPLRAFPPACFGASVLVAVAVYYSGQADSGYALYFVLVEMYVAYFLSVRQLFWQTLFIAFVYGVVGLQIDSGEPFGRDWLLTIWTVLVVGAFIATLRQRVDHLIDRLSNAASTDPLTHLLNRRGFRDVFDLELERSRRSGRPCALLMADLDHFKRVNDMLGHPAGDERLRKFASLLESGKRRIDASARMGGEEFALLLPETDEHGAYVIAERLRHAVRDAFAPDQLPLTVSFGVAAYPNHGATGDQLLQAADQALYVAKELGRDRTAIYRAEVTAQMLSLKDRTAMRADGYLSAMLVLAEAVDLRDGGASTHSETVGRYAELIAAELGLDEDRVQRVKLAGILHDIGKVGVPDDVLQKAGPLDDNEREEIQKHCELGSRLLNGAGLEDIAGWVLSSHERPDGRGYPGGLSGAEIPPESRILAVADAYEAMVADRCYRPGIGADRARAELENGVGTQFDPLVVAAFLQCLERADRALGVR
jgi:diguanylate cyclase (GGDEF)-like protein/putative nucleotidyltransferase with HDIG domain